MPEDPLKKIDSELKNKLESLKGDKQHQEFLALAALLSQNITEELRQGMSMIQVPAANVSVNLNDVLFPPFPEIKVPEINVNVPEIKLPKFEFTVPPAPKAEVVVKIPPINIPKPEVTVNVPEAKAPIVNIPPFPKFPDSMSVTGDVGLRDVNSKKPLPVIMMDGGGKPFSFSQAVAGGGRGDFFTIAGFNSSIGATLIDSSGVAYSGSNPFPTSAVVTFTVDIGPGDGATALRVLQAGNTVSSVNVLAINSNTPATGLNETTSGVLRVVQMSDTVSSVYVNNPFNQGDTATALRIVHAGDSAVSVSATQVGTWNITTVTGITNSIAGSLIDSSGVGYSGSNPFPVNNTSWNANTVSTNDGEVGVGTLRTVHAADIGTSVNVTSVAGNAISVNPGDTNTGTLRVVQALASSFNQNQISIGTGTTIVLAANTSRIKVTVINHGTTNVFLGGPAVTASTGVLLQGTAGYPVLIRSSSAIYGITSSGSQTVSYIEEVQ